MEDLTPDQIEKLDKEFREEMASASEFHLYLTASALRRVLQTVREDIESKKIGRKDLQMLEDVAKIVAQTRDKYLIVAREASRFGPIFGPESLDPMENQPNGEESEFKLWFMWWGNFIHSLSEEDWERLKGISESGGDTSILKPPGTWKVDPNAMRDGAVPGSWVRNKVDDIDVERDFGAMYVKQDTEKLDEFRAFLKGDDEIWIFEDPKTWKAGYVAVSNKRPVAMITIIISDERREPTAASA